MWVSLGYADQRTVALTIDDLPFVGESKNFHLEMLIDAIKNNGINATGFVIAKEVNEKNLSVLQKFRDAGLGIGNHTLSHANLNKLSVAAYINEIAAADQILEHLLSQPKYFRYPYLVMGSGIKRASVLEYLRAKHYRIAPISIDTKDFIFNQLLLSVPQNERRNFLIVLKPCYLNFIWQQTLKAEEHTRYLHKPDQTQILLIHANLLNAYVLSDIINMYKQQGFKFVTLEHAMKSIDGASLAAPQTKSEEFVAWD